MLVGLFKHSTKCVSVIIHHREHGLEDAVVGSVDVGIHRVIPMSASLRNRYVLKLNSSLYELKQASANCYDMLSKGLEN